MEQGVRHWSLSHVPEADDYNVDEYEHRSKDVDGAADDGFETKRMYLECIEGEVSTNYPFRG